MPSIKPVSDLSNYAEVLECITVGNPAVSRIIRNLKNLKDMPGVGTPLSSKVSFDTDYRFLICGNYGEISREE